MELQFSIESKQAYIIAVATITLVTILSGYLKYVAKPVKRLAPGTFGFPVIGESIGFLIAFKHNKAGDWVQDHIDKYGPVFKTSILGRKTIFLTGQAGNKFTLGSSISSGLTANQPPHVAKLVGKNGVLELTQTRHKLVRSVITSLLNPGNLQRYVSQIDLIVKQQIFQETGGKESIKMVPLMKKLSFKVASHLLFGLLEEKENDALSRDFELVLKGVYSIPVNFPGTTFHKALQARGRICKKLSNVISRWKCKIENGTFGQAENIISCFLSLKDENGNNFTEEFCQKLHALEIARVVDPWAPLKRFNRESFCHSVFQDRQCRGSNRLALVLLDWISAEHTQTLDNLITLIIASHDPSTVLLCSFISKLAKSSEVYDKVLEEQREVVKASKERDGKITWSEIQMMKYTWTAVQELMRLSSPVPTTFRAARRDTAFNDFDIPKGWQVAMLSSPTHMNKDIFEDPKKFDPTRFERQNKSSIPPWTYIPFGAGERSCPRSEFARIATLLIIHHLVTNYSWTEMISDEPITCLPLPYPAMGLPVKLNSNQARPT